MWRRKWGAPGAPTSVLTGREKEPLKPWSHFPPHPPPWRFPFPPLIFSLGGGALRPRTFRSTTKEKKRGGQDGGTAVELTVRWGEEVDSGCQASRQVLSLLWSAGILAPLSYTSSRLWAQSPTYRLPITPHHRLGLWVDSRPEGES